MLAMLQLLILGASLLAQAGDALHWRLIGPFRGGRTVAVSGVPQQRGVYYFAATDGGVWKTTDYGRTWQPVFDGQDTGSVGALAVAPSDPNVVYAGSGEGLRRPDLSTGDGIYKSTDGGKTWSHLGLRDGRQINAIAVDPHDANRVFAAVMGRPYGPSTERGVYRSTDGGTSWQKVLGNDADTGSAMVVIDPNHPQTLYADLWASRNPPWRLRDILQLWNRGGLYKSTDGGATWTQLHGGLPAGVGRIGLAVAQSDSNRLYAWVNDADGCGIYRSSDAGATWTKTNSEERVCGRGDDFSGVAVDPADADIVYAANTSTYRSTDAGKTWTAIKGAPGGDDYHTIWIDPTDRNIILLGVDQGATLSVNYGRTWSSWYNQPTAQFYHVITDNRFPYWVFGGQQESGSAEVASRSEDGEIWIRYWHPVGAQEYAYIAPDPLHPDIIYGAGIGVVSRYDERTQQTQDVSPDYQGKYRWNRTTPIVFSYVDKRTLYLGSNVMFSTTDGGRHWRTISPDLTRANPGKPPSLGAFAQTKLAQGPHRGEIFSIGPSYLDRNVIWAGTDDGLVWVTNDGGVHWRNVTPPGIAPWSQIAQIDASHFDKNTAYVAVNATRIDDDRPYIYRTHDGGRTWQLAVSGLPDDQSTNTVREDPVRRSLLFAGNERTVYASFDDGSHWQPLQLNLPSTSVRDMVVHGNDLVVGTHGRSFWILDDVSALRDPSIAARENSAQPYLFQPALAYRLRRDTWTDTPLPPEEPAGKNPPDGAIFDYYLPAQSSGPVTISVYDSSGKQVRRYSSSDQPVPVVPGIDKPTYWVAPAQIPSTAAGMHRIVWNYRYPDPDAVTHDYPISAIYEDTPRIPQGVLAVPGTYTVRMTVDGHTSSRTFTLRMDPRIALTAAQLREQFNLASRIVSLMHRTYLLRSNEQMAALNDQLAQMLDVVEGSDAAPTVQARTAIDAIERTINAHH
ncbi:MAG TPA: hypothetical protein VGZ02_08905 [Candidatus Baltobacteraceae bacterium]|jgi:photosystem II stability/assembly factor-like uncharacterized protein|nr:hypothetical protein [Candidatus Baltobacteraceae bacterium]